MMPTGRMKKPTPNVAVVSNNEANWLSAGKNSREITTVRTPKIMKSYHSSAFPITAAATWSGFGVAWVTGMDDSPSDHIRTSVLRRKPAAFFVMSTRYRKIVLTAERLGTH